MITKNIIEGLSILEKYRDNIDGYNTGAEHDIIYAYATEKPLEEEDLKQMVELGWFQENVDYEDDFSAENYHPSEGWSCYT